MKMKITLGILLLFVLSGVVFYISAYQLFEGKQAVITQFGDPIRFVTDAGLHFKIPFIQEVHLLEKRLLPWDGAAESMQTRDQETHLYRFLGAMADCQRRKVLSRSAHRRPGTEDPG